MEEHLRRVIGRLTAHSYALVFTSHAGMPARRPLQERLCVRTPRRLHSGLDFSDFKPTCSITITNAAPTLRTHITLDE